MKPTLTIVGRPNVGKSTLFNRLVGERRALVDDMPGVTRDRHYGECRAYERPFVVIDTGGFEPDAKDDLLALMRAQAELAMEEADSILLLLDGKEGLTSTDLTIITLLHRSKARVFVAVNKLESKKRHPAAMEFLELGLGEGGVRFISAEHGLGIGDLMEDILASFPPEDEEEEAELREDELSVAVVGRPNVGKSTLINRLLGQERLLASDKPGTTRDAIDSLLVRRTTAGERRYRLIDTAGVRRKRSIDARVESLSVVKAFKAIDRAQVVVLLFDATEPFVEQEARLAGMIHEKGRAVVLVVNKWDCIKKDTDTAGAFVKRVREHLKFMPYAPVLFASAKSGQRVSRLLDLVDRAAAGHQLRVPTAAVNRFLEKAVARHEPPIHRTKRVRIFYLTQVAVRPPTFVAVTNYPEALHFSYERYLLNGLREEFGFEGTPVRLKFRLRTRREHNERVARREHD